MGKTNGSALTADRRLGKSCWFSCAVGYDTSDPPCYCRSMPRDQAKRKTGGTRLLFGLFAAFLCAALLLITQWRSTIENAR